MTSFFPTSVQSKAAQYLDIDLYNEYDVIQRAILAGAQIQQYQAVVNTSPMTQFVPPNPITFTATVSNSYLTAINHGFKKFDTVILQTTGILPAPIQAGYFYYVNPIDSDNFQLFTTKEKVLANIFIPLVNTGTGIHSSTLIPTSQLYYQVWLGQITDNTLDSKMNSVIQYFTDLGYTISRKANTTTSTFYWSVQW
jgi:hypothetical protein